MLYVTFVLTVLLHIWSSAHLFLEEILNVTRVSTVWPNLCKAEKTSSHLSPTGQHSQLGRGDKSPVRDLCRKRWSLEEKCWWPGNSELCESCRGSLCSVPSVWYRFQSGSGWSPPVHRCLSDPTFGDGSKCSVVSGLRRQSYFQRCHWATKSCKQEKNIRIIMGLLAQMETRWWRTLAGELTCSRLSAKSNSLFYATHLLLRL